MSDLPSYELFAASAARAPAALKAAAAAPSVTINGTAYSLDPAQDPQLCADTSLADFIRTRTRFTGTKVSCNEGGCGACTVMLTFTNPSTNATETRGVNACLRPVLACNGMSVTTNDGLVTKDPATGKPVYHPIQQALASHNGSQCGFCSNGMVMNMYDMLQNAPSGGLTPLQVEQGFDGNLCRCTGYRPILDAMKTFATAAGHEDCEADDCRKKGCQRRQAIFPDLEDVGRFIKHDHGPYEHKGPAGKPLTTAPAKLSDQYGVSWNEVDTLAALQSALSAAAGSDYMLVNGQTSLAIFKDHYPTNRIFIGNIPELKKIYQDPSFVYIGGAVLIVDVIKFLESAAPTSQTIHFPQIVAHLRRIAGRQIRNAGSLAGNIMVAHTYQSPTKFFCSDAATVLMGIGAQVQVTNCITNTTATLSMAAFFSSSMNGCYISQIIIPLASSPNEHFVTYKIASRQVNSHAIVNGAMFVVVDPATGLMSNANITIGGINPVPTRFTALEASMNGNSSTDPLKMQIDITAFGQSLNPCPYGGPAAFRKAAAVNYVYKFFLSLQSNLSPALSSGANCWMVRPLSTGTQTWQPNPAEYPVSAGTPKIEAIQQTSGMAKYTQDLPKQADATLYARLVLSTQANATISHVDTSAAQAVAGFVAYYGAADMLPNTNQWSNGPIFASTTITYYGQSIGVVVATSEVAAKKAADAVSVSYTNVAAPVVNLQTAVNAKNFFPMKFTPVTRGNAATAIQQAPVVVSGSMEIGAQNHMHLENHVSTVVPREDVFEVHSSTQMPLQLQGLCAQVAGVPSNKVTVSTKRCGGGFGGKITSSLQVAAIATLCALKTGEAVQLVVPMDQLTSLFGGRGGKIMSYTVGLATDGTIQGMQATVYCGAGSQCTDEVGSAITCLNSLDNCYLIPNANFEAVGVFRNTAPAAPVRGPGWVPAVTLMECVIAAIASKTGMTAEAVREKNFFKVGDVTCAGMTLKYWNMPTIWSQLKTMVNFDTKVAAAQAYNGANRWTKRGVAMSPVRFGVGQAGANFDSIINIYADGSVAISHGGCEIGQGINTKAIQVVAYKFGIDVSQVSCNETNTRNISGQSNVTGGSVTSELCALSLMNAADTLLARLNPLRTSGMSWVQLVQAASGAGVELTATGWTNAPAPVNGGPFNYNTTAASVAEVEIDVLTGQLEVRSLDILFDCGISMNAMLDVGQVEGGFMFGAGYLLQEEISWDPTTGQTNNGTTWEYKIPSAYDIPESFNITLLKNSPNPLGVLSSKACGEPGVCMAPSVLQAAEIAITAARADNGLGNARWICTQAPLTVEKVLAACGTAPTQFVLQ